MRSAAEREGWFIEPTVIRGALPDEEIFGPVVTVEPFDGEDDAVRRANDSEFGLAASVWSRDLAKADRVARRIEAGMVWVNDFGYSFTIGQAPWGGVKGSGFGRTALEARSLRLRADQVPRQRPRPAASRVVVPVRRADGARAAHAARRALRQSAPSALRAAWRARRDLVHVGEAVARPMSDLSHVDEAGAVRMVDVGAKPLSRRRAVARAEVRMAPETARRLRDLPKGDALTTAQLAGIMAAKRTSDLIPLCHPLPLSHIEVTLEVREDSVEIVATAETTAQTGVEMEALTAASVAALTVYDMAKAIDKADGDRRGTPAREDEGAGLKAAVLTLSDRVSRGVAEDTSGDLLEELLRAEGFEVERRVVPDEREQIAAALRELVARRAARPDDGRHRPRAARRHARGDARGARPRRARHRAGDPRRLDREDAARPALARPRRRRRRRRSSSTCPARRAAAATASPCSARRSRTR